ncbi:SDR family oxidoreductase [Tetragenococcus koreensis]|uniref:SDR family oxidoreductase n=1 Tax=Tetragenococcus koreensis TaxID=290335 RepID=UPI001F1F3871|nr:SDR family oxidoreductase [Tetragenococcus koreensis]MDN6640451.1 SDR family oxidoreductase [Tetragenococcus sp.]MCF1585983.1 SDR family oxidoreductase [Tetragenococcus koreensis]MCF1615560.1 SDR family oxidoreductase [Tetragenococcus koreensis]MCF1619158.1 SDR family oxidoreductase [Tetragenococcus koreensis]MCF1625357.1 SDR family oxidoreductase [Tetragenococcus koreensis]
MDWLNLQDKTVIVTGGSSGIGEAIVQELCHLGVNVVNADVQRGKFEHGKLNFVNTDVTSLNSVKQAVNTALDRFGNIDGVVNNAGINIPALLVDEKQAKDGKYEIDENLFEKVFEVNQKGVFLMSQVVGKELVKQGAGVIINMSSESGLEGSEGQSVYAATKAAVNSYTRSWAKELGKKGVRVVGIAPGIMEETGLRTIAYEEALAYTRNKTVDELRAGYNQTSTIPLGRSGRLCEVADLVAYLLSDRASYISGVTINVAGGKTRG